MREFFLDEIPGTPFKLFGLLHFICILIVIVGVFVIWRNKEKIISLNYKTKRKIAIFIVLTMFLNMKLYYIPLIIYNKYNWMTNLPLHFCFISGYLFMYAIFTNNRKIYKIVYFFSFVGPIPAILWPDIIGGPDTFLFYQLFFSHHFFLLGSLFIFYAYDHNFSFKDLKKAFIVANIIFTAVFIFNLIFKTNYIMQKNLPEHIMKLFPFLEKFNHPIIILEITGLIIMFIAYIPIYFQNKSKNNSLQHAESLL